MKIDRLFILFQKMQQAFFAPNHDFGASSCSVKLTLPEIGFYTDVICAAGARCRLAPLMGKRGIKHAEITGKKQAAFRHGCSVFADAAFFFFQRAIFLQIMLAYAFDKRMRTPKYQPAAHLLMKYAFFYCLCLPTHLISAIMSREREECTHSMHYAL